MTIFETLFGKGRHSNAPTVGTGQRGQKKKHPALLLFLIKFYSFTWLTKILTLPFRYFSVNVSKKFITISFPFLEKKKPEIKTPVLTPPEPYKIAKTYFVYILRSLKNGKFYIGTTEDLYGNFKRHNDGGHITTFDFRPFELIYYEASVNYFDAKDREKYFRSPAGEKFLKKRLHRFLIHHPVSRIQRILKIATFVSVQILILFIPTLVAILYAPQQTIAAWFNENWNYRVSLTITHNAVVTNNKVKFDIDTATLITNGQMQADCGDSRFTDQNGKLLPYYLDTAGGACNGASTDYYVLIPTVNNGTTVIYHYYGNPSAPNGTTTTQLSYETLSPSGGAASAGSEEKGPGPIGYWKFDENGDNTCKDGARDACDSSANGNDLSNIDAVWKTSDMCISGSCFEFLGISIGSQLTRPDDNDFDFAASESFSMAGWFHHAPISSGTDIIIARHSAVLGGEGGFKIYMDSDGDIVCGIDDDNSWGPDASAGTTNANYDDNQWHHFECVKNGTSSLTLYIDGQQVNQNASISSIGSLANSHVFIIGSQNDGGGAWKGFLDEIKVYRYARTAAQVKVDAQRGAASIESATVLGQASTNFLNQGLVGYWKMDETSAWTNDCSTQSITDSSGNGKHGISCPSSAGPLGTAQGKFGYAGDFGGSPEYVQIDNPELPTEDFTYSFWMKPSQASGVHYILAIAASPPDDYLAIDLTDGQMSLTFAGSTFTNTTPIVAGRFYHVVFTRKDGVITSYVDAARQEFTTQVSYIPDLNNCAMIIGDETQDCPPNPSGLSYEGILDDIRIYNRALSFAEVRALYNWAPGPVLHYKFDENTGTTSVFDTSGNGETGTLTNFTSRSWAIGKYGSALAFNGSNQYISVTTPNMPTNDFTATAWVRTTASNATILQSSDGNGGAEFRLTVGMNADAGTIGVDLDDNPVSDTATLINDNKWHHIATTRNDSLVNIFIDGVFSSSGTSNITLDFTEGLGTPCELLIGVNNINNCTDSLGNYFQGNIDDIRIYNYSRNQAQIIEDMNGGHPVGGSPVGSQLIYTKFDEQNGNTINNAGFGSSTYNGTNTGAVWLPNTKCKSNSCIHFDTTTDNIGFIDIPDVDSVASMSASLWINPQALATTRSIVSKINTSPSNNFAVVTDSSNSDELRIYIASSTSDTSNYFLTSNFDLSANSWQYLSFVYDGTLPAANRIKVFKNGRQVSGSVVGTIPSVTTTSSSSLLRLGDDEGTTHTSLLMYLDEFKFYIGALTQDQLLIDYNMGSAVNFNTGASLEASQSADAAGNPPVGYWNLDEGSGLTAKDISGNGNDGTITIPKNPTYVPGKFGSAVNLLGAATFVDMGNPTTLRLGAPITLSGWVYPTSFSATQYIIRKRESGAFAGRYELFVDTNGKANFSVNQSGNTPTTLTGSTTLSLNKWNFVAATLVNSTAQRIYLNGIQDGFTAVTQGITTSTGSFTIGVSGTTNSGIVDEVKLFNYVRTPAQIAYDYNRGAPIGWWKFDECQGETAYNASLIPDLNGIIDPNASGNTASGNCTSGTATHMWNDGANGKFYGSLGFDAIDDIVTITNSNSIDMDGGLSEGLTLAAWVYVNSDGENDNGHIVAKSDTTFIKVSGESGGRVTIDGSLDLSTDATVSVNSAITTGAWHHIALSWTNDSDDEITLWIDGQSRGTSTNGVGPPSSDTTNLFIGNRSAEDRTFDGQIDDVRVYNYELSASQLRKTVNEGSGVRFGPQTGFP